MFKAARNRLVEKGVLKKEDAPSYFIECLLYNVPDGLFAEKLAPTCADILDWLRNAQLKGFVCQNGQVPLFRRWQEQWSQKKARAFVRAPQELWDREGKNTNESLRMWETLRGKQESIGRKQARSVQQRYFLEQWQRGRP